MHGSYALISRSIASSIFFFPLSRFASTIVRELVGRCRRARGRPARSPCAADLGFDSRHVVKACRDHDVRYSITAPESRSAAGDRGNRRGVLYLIDYTEGGEAWVAETTYGDGHRLVVRRTRLPRRSPARSSPSSATTPSSPTGTATWSPSTPTTDATR